MTYHPIRITVYGRSIHVKCPYEEDMNARLREMGGKFNRCRKEWILGCSFESEVRSLLREYFGKDDGEVLLADWWDYEVKVYSMGDGSPVYYQSTRVH